MELGKELDKLGVLCIPQFEIFRFEEQELLSLFSKISWKNYAKNWSCNYVFDIKYYIQRIQFDKRCQLWSIFFWKTTLAGEKWTGAWFFAILLSCSILRLLGGIHKLSTFTRFGFFLPPNPLRLHFLWYKSLQKVDFFYHLPPSSCKRSLWMAP